MKFGFSRVSYFQVCVVRLCISGVLIITLYFRSLSHQDFTSHRCTFEYPSWVNLCSPTLDCTANLQLLKRQRSVTLYFRSLSNQDFVFPEFVLSGFVFPEFVLSGLCISGVCLIRICISRVCLIRTLYFRSLSHQDFLFPEFVLSGFVFPEFV